MPIDPGVDIVGIVHWIRRELQNLPALSFNTTLQSQQGHGSERLKPRAGRSWNFDTGQFRRLNKLFIFTDSLP